MTIFTAQLANMATCAVHITISKVVDQLVVSAIDRQTVLTLQCIAALTRGENFPGDVVTGQAIHGPSSQRRLRLHGAHRQNESRASLQSQSHLYRPNKCSAVAEMGDRLATIDTDRKWGAVSL